MLYWFVEKAYQNERFLLKLTPSELKLIFTEHKTLRSATFHFWMEDKLELFQKILFKRRSSGHLVYFTWRWRLEIELNGQRKHKKRQKKLDSFEKLKNRNYRVYPASLGQHIVWFKSWLKVAKVDFQKTDFGEIQRLQTNDSLKLPGSLVECTALQDSGTKFGSQTWNLLRGWEKITLAFCSCLFNKTCPAQKSIQNEWRQNIQKTLRNVSENHYNK